MTGEDDEAPPLSDEDLFASSIFEPPSPPPFEHDEPMNVELRSDKKMSHFFSFFNFLNSIIFLSEHLP